MCLRVTVEMHLNYSYSKEHLTEFSPPTLAHWGRWWGPHWTGWARQWSGCFRSWSSCCLPSVRTSGPPVAGRFAVGRRSYFDFLSDQFYQKNSWDSWLPESRGTQTRWVCLPPGSRRRTRPFCWIRNVKTYLERQSGVTWYSDRSLWLKSPPVGSRLFSLIVSGCYWYRAAGQPSAPFLRDTEGLGCNLAENIFLQCRNKERLAIYLEIVDIRKEMARLLVQGGRPRGGDEALCELHAELRV